MYHTLVATVENRPGVLNRVASLFRRRNFNIASLTVGETEDPTISRMTVVVDTRTTRPHFVIESLYKLVNVLEVRDLTGRPSVQRDLLLLKVEADAASRAEILQFATLYQARIVHVARSCLLVELCGTPEAVDAFVTLLRPFGIREMVRTGVVAMETEPVTGESAPAHFIAPLVEREGV